VGTVHELTRVDARRIAVRAQLLDGARIDAIHQDVTFTETTADAVDHEIKDLAHWLELDLIPPGRS
jgi:hypothetical protein